ncbi:MAG: hypothetical protein KBA26_14475, partial [Candidatus Delongbacteria bacterium]|nr:hypothetical protein [Candidatus Delongbacteria bacterium]
MKLKPKLLAAFGLIILAAINILYYTTSPPVITSTLVDQRITDYIRANPSFLQPLVTPTLDNRYRLHDWLSKLERELSREFSLQTLYLMIQGDDKQICWNRAIPDSIFPLLSMTDPYPKVIPGYYSGKAGLTPSVHLMYIAQPARPSSSWPTLLIWLNLLIIFMIVHKISLSHPKSIMSILVLWIALEFFLAGPLESPGFHYHSMLFIFPFGVSFHALGLAIILIVFIMLNLITGRSVTKMKSSVSANRQAALILIYSVFLNGFIFYSLTGLILENEQYFLSHLHFLPSEMTFYSYLILALILIVWQTGMKNLRRVAPIGFMLILILWTILLTYSGHWILTASLIWMILFALIPFNHVKRAWLWN